MRLMQLTALASCIGFVTDVFDDGASARMDRDSDGSPPGRALVPDDLDGAVPTPPSLAAPTAPAPAVSNELGLAPEELAADRAAVQAFLPRECVHEVSAERPRLTRNEQERTEQVITHVTRRLKASEPFHKLLKMVAARESSLQQGLVHRLSPDLEGSYSAWRKMQKTYEGNPHADDPGLWQTYGLFGMNSNYFTLLWDKAADPRVLCDAVVDVLVYRRAAVRMIRKSGGNIVCKDEQGRSFDYTTRPTWETIHRAVSGGKLCPSTREQTAATMSKFFRTRALKAGINPDQPVTLKMLGVEPSQGLDGAAWPTQEAMVMGLWAEFDAEHPRADVKAQATAPDPQPTPRPDRVATRGP